MKSLLIFLVLFSFALGHNALNKFLGPESSMTDSHLMEGLPKFHNKIGVEASIKFTAYPTTIEDGEDVEIKWGNIPNPSTNDFVSVSCGPTNDLNDVLDFKNVTAKEVASKSGSVRFENLVMMRCNYDFMYVSCDAHYTCSALAKTTVVMRNGLNFPHQGHISFTSNPKEMAVTYVSRLNTTAASVRYGKDATKLNMVVQSSKTVTYSASDMCNAPANWTSQVWFRDPGFIHHIVLQNLEYSTVYYYQFGNDVDGWSEVSHFLSRPSPAGVSAFPVTKFLAYADMGVWEPGSFLTAFHSTMEVENGFNNFLLHFGDISYARGNGWQWDFFFHMLESYATKVPYLASIGNHEYDHIAGGQKDPSGAPGIGWHPNWGNMGDDSSGECAVPPFHRFVTPQNGNGIFWYSFDYGAVHVIQISSEHDWTKNSAQYQWLEQDLASVDRSKTPWVILTSHRMMYTTQLQEDADYIVSEHFKQEADDLINDYGVNLMLVGHQHSYERSCPVYNRECVKNGQATVHIIVGTSGAGLETGGFSNKLGNWSVAHTERFGYCRLTADASSLFVEFIDSNSGSVFDETVLYPWFGNKFQQK